MLFRNPFSCNDLAQEFNTELQNREATREFNIWYAHLDDEDTIKWVDILIDSIEYGEEDLMNYKRNSLYLGLALLQVIMLLFVWLH